MPVVFENISFTYALKTPFQYQALKDINLTIKDGSFTAIVGHTGSGKSTLIQHINALLLPTKGRIIVDDMIIDSNKKNKKLRPFRQKSGLVFQFPEYQLFEETVEKDVSFGPRNFGDNEQQALAKAHKALKAVGIEESYYKRSPFELSGGERRRVAIAGIIAMEPKILILDEPTAGLDPRGAKKMMELFANIHQQGTTVILVTHDMNIVLKYATDVVVMKDGQIVKQTTPYQLFNGPYQEYNLEIPRLYELGSLLIKRGYKLSLDKIKSIEDIVTVIVKQGCKI
jgi:energy-coupling factor transport system ATP-binding protein